MQSRRSFLATLGASLPVWSVSSKGVASAREPFDGSFVRVLIEAGCSEMEVTPTDRHRTVEQVVASVQPPAIVEYVGDSARELAQVCIAYPVASVEEGLEERRAAYEQRHRYGPVVSIEVYR